MLTGIAGGNTGDPVLNALYQVGGQAGAGSSNPIPALALAEKNKTKSIAATAKQPQVARDIAAFLAAVGAAKDPATLLKNPAAMKVLLTANALGDQISYSALASKALLSDTSNTKSLANQLTDTRWKSAAQTYDFYHKGLSVLQDPKVLSTIADGYAEITWRKSLDATTPGLSNALSFRDIAGTITSAIQILGDPTMRTVVTTALGIPKEIAFQTLAAQERAITSKVDITKFNDPKFVENFTKRYLLAASAEASQTPTTAPSLITLAIQARGLIA